jgi:hypothetical protein
MTYSLPGANHDEQIQLAVVISPSAGLGRSSGFRAMWRFRWIDQSRIAGVCREISLFRF